VTAPTEETIQGGGGKLFLRSWRPVDAPKAVVAICHGFNSHGGYYLWVGDQLAAHGFAVYAVDLRGRGKSEGERFYVQSVDDYVADVQAMIATAKARDPGLPVFLLGHSAGGVTSCVYTLDHGAEIVGLICEDFAFEVPAPDLALTVLKGIAHIAPHAPSLTLHNADFSRDPAVVKALNDDPLVGHESQPFATAAALVHADERLKKSFGQITLPVLIIHGMADKATRPSGSQHFFDGAGSADKTLKLYEGRFHDPLNDLGKEEVMSDILAWIDARLG